MVSHFGLWFDKNVVPMDQNSSGGKEEVEAGEGSSSQGKIKKRSISKIITTDLIMSFHEIFKAYKCAHSSYARNIELYLRETRANRMRKETARWLPPYEVDNSTIKKAYFSSEELTLYAPFGMQNSYKEWLQIFTKKSTNGLQLGNASQSWQKSVKKDEWLPETPRAQGVVNAKINLGTGTGTLTYRIPIIQRRKMRRIKKAKIQGDIKPKEDDKDNIKLSPDHSADADGAAMLEKYMSALSLNMQCAAPHAEGDGDGGHDVDMMTSSNNDLSSTPHADCTVYPGMCNGSSGYWCTIPSGCSAKIPASSFFTSGQLLVQLIHGPSVSVTPDDKSEMSSCLSMLPVGVCSSTTLIQCHAHNFVTLSNPQQLQDDAIQLQDDAIQLQDDAMVFVSISQKKEAKKDNQKGKASTASAPSAHVPSVGTAPVGIKWKDNNCYATASLQILYSIQSLRDYVLKTNNHVLHQPFKYLNGEPNSHWALDQKFLNAINLGRVPLGSTAEADACLRGMLQEYNRNISSPNPITILTLTLPNKKLGTLQDIVDEQCVFEPETILGNHVILSLRRSMATRRNIVSIHEKPLKSVPFSITLNDVSFNLIAFITYHNTTPGHYIPCVKQDNEWWSIDGNKVDKVCNVDASNVDQRDSRSKRVKVLHDKRFQHGLTTKSVILLFQRDS